MAGLAEIRKAIRTTLEDPGIPGLTTYNKIPSQMNYPCVVVHPDDIDYTKAFQRGLIVMDFNLIVLVSSLDMSEIAQDDLDELVNFQGPRSIPFKIYQNKSLGLDSVEAHISSMSNYMVRYLNAHVGATLKLRVLTR